MRKLLLGCALALSVSPAMAQSVQEMQKLAEQWQGAFNNGDAAAVASNYKEDAVIFPPGADMVKGREAIQKAWAEASKSISIANFKVTDVKALGPNAARDQGYATVRTKGANPQEMVGKYVIVWEKINGKWLIDSDIWNMNETPLKTAQTNGEIYWSVTFDIPQGKMDAFKSVVSKLVAETKKEPGTVQYEYTESPDHRTVDIIERYVDSSAVIQHVTKTFPKYGDEFLANSKVGRFIVYGPINDEAKKALAGFNPVYFTPFDGFTR
jgi:uncharacterized protein (TIGR02246 family)